MNHKTLNSLKNSFDENKNSHAFLVETNNIEMCLNEIRRLICEINALEINEFDETNLPDVKIIRPDGKEIKREQISEILDEFQTYPVLLKHRYYIIVQSEKMNLSSANTILKFLEEPDGDVIGFFLTGNKSAMISTIMSRCQHYKIFYTTNFDVDVEKIEDFLEQMKCDELYKRILFLNNFVEKDRVNNIKSFKDMKEYLLKNKNSDNIEQLNLLVNRVRLLDNIIERLLKNANQELLILDIARNWM